MCGKLKETATSNIIPNICNMVINHCQPITRMDEVVEQQICFHFGEPLSKMKQSMAAAIVKKTESVWALNPNGNMKGAVTAK